MLFFIQTTRFYPDKFEQLGFNRNDDGLYVYTKDKSLWKERALLDLGYGKEKGLVRILELCFESLIQLVYESMSSNFIRINVERMQLLFFRRKTNGF